MYTKKTIGIWGLGKVGISAAKFLNAQGARIIGMDAKAPAPEVRKLFEDIIPEDKKADFFTQSDYLIVSPGIDIRPYYAQLQPKLITELDLFFEHWKKPIIAITGSVGKTTITHLLSQLLTKYGLRVTVGGNIGTPMLDLLDTASEHEMALLEVSSFQLEYCKEFAPDLALWTNFAPNHLDRHTLDEYFQAKSKLCEFQTALQQAIVPYQVYEQLKLVMPEKKFRIMCDTQVPEPTPKGNVIYQLHDSCLIKITDSGAQNLINISTLPPLTFTQNWINIAATLDTLGYKLDNLAGYAQTLTMPAHRMEKITVGNITFYNDSKSTTVASTCAAVEQLQVVRPTLLLGGLGKGVDRAPLIDSLRGKIKKIVCFGKEQQVLLALCTQYEIPATGHDTLDAAFADCVQNIQPGDTVLLSPSGSSYDLFKNYEERGDHFKKLIASFETTYCNYVQRNGNLQTTP